MLEKLPLIIIISISAIIIFVLLLVSGVIPGLREPVTPAIKLTIWGVFDSAEVFDEIISSYQKIHRNIEIKYFKKNELEYEKELINTLAGGEGPDIWYIHNTWLPKHKGKISPMPLPILGREKEFKFITPYEFKEDFVNVASQDFLDEEKIYALPLYLDTLAIYWNKDIFGKEKIPTPPKDWHEFIEVVPKLTKLDERGNILQAGVALGTARNINRSTDILAALMLQGGINIVDKERQEVTLRRSVRVGEEEIYPGLRALEFYTDFANPLKKVYTWNKDMHYSIDSFYEGRTAMMINYAHHLPTIRKKAPRLNFGISPLPQPRDIQVPVNYPNFWGLTVASTSKNPEAAWEFLTYLSKAENIKKYLQVSQRPTARRDLILWQKVENPELSVFLDQALTAKSWYQPDNLAVDRIFADMIESVVEGANPEEALKAASGQLALYLK